MAVKEQNSSDRIVLDEQQAELRDQVETSRQLVYGFLQDELQQDVPTGKIFNHRLFLLLCFVRSQNPIHLVPI